MDLICTHRDFDGVVAAALLVRSLRLSRASKERVSFFSYGERDSLIDLATSQSWDHVYVLDFSLEASHLDTLAKCSSPVTYVDHHLTSLRQLQEVEGLDQVIVDTNFCTVDLVCNQWKSDLPKTVVDQWRQLARVRDFGLDSELERDARLVNFVAIARPYELLSDILRGLAPSQVISRRKPIWKRREEGLQRSLSLARLTKYSFVLRGVRCCVVFTVSDVQDVALHFLRSFSVVFVGLVLSEGSILPVSLRTNLDSLDLSRVAEVWGGGGHARAAGFSYSLKPSDNFESIRSFIVSEVAPLVLEHQEKRL